MTFNNADEILAAATIIRAARDAAVDVTREPELYHPRNQAVTQFLPNRCAPALTDQECGLFLDTFRDEVQKQRAKLVRHHNHQLGGIDALINGEAISDYCSDVWRRAVLQYKREGSTKQ